MASAARSSLGLARRGRRRRGASRSLCATPGGAQLGAGVAAERRVHDDAVGQLVAGRWWSVTTTSIPAARAAATSADGGDPAVHRHEQAHAPLGQPLDRAPVDSP